MNLKKTIKSKIIAHLDDELDGVELQELFDWIKKSKENARYYTEVKDLWEASIANASEIADTKKEWKRFLDKIGHQKKAKTPTYTFAINVWMKMAAVLVVGALIGSLVSTMLNKASPVYFTAVAPKGSVSQMILPDSTLIYLNAGSQIKYAIDQNSKQREVFLKGEAWFQVTKNKAKPFIVHTLAYDVRVLGTEFNVKCYSEDSVVETTLEKGSILIQPSEIFKMSQTVKLVPNEQFVYDRKAKTLIVKKVNPKYFSAWKDNKLIFVNMELKDLFVILERKFGVEIEVKNKAILDYHYDGTIKNESIIEILEMIQKTMAVCYKIESQKIIIYNK